MYDEELYAPYEMKDLLPSLRSVWGRLISNISQVILLILYVTSLF